MAFLSEAASNMLGYNLSTGRAIITIFDKRDQSVKIQSGGKKTSGMYSIPVPGMDGIKRYMVQFNPSTLSLQAQGGGKAQMTSMENNAGTIKVMTLSPRIILTVPLIFDRVYNKDAFTCDKFMLSPTSMATMAGAGIYDAIMGNDYSVQTEVEGFVGALRQNSTRLCGFTWGEMDVQGILNGVEASYVMFSPSGNPIRATVTITMLILDTSINDEIERKLDVDPMDPWAGAVEDVFQKPGIANKVNLTKNSQLVGNLLNIRY